MREIYKVYTGEKKCDFCMSNATIEISKFMPMHYNDGFIYNYYCKPCYEAKQEEARVKARSPEAIEDLRKMLLDKGMDSKEVQRMIMNLLNNKE